MSNSPTATLSPVDDAASGTGTTGGAAAVRTVRRTESRHCGGGRIDGLDALRGVAALAVVVYHFTNSVRRSRLPSGGGDVWFSFPTGAYGVHLFFLISGFVIFLTVRRAPTAVDFAF